MDFSHGFALPNRRTRATILTLAAEVLAAVHAKGDADTAAILRAVPALSTTTLDALHA
jgi:hypothetical protein